MLARTLKNNLKDLSNYKMRTKATKFSAMFSSNPTTENTVDVRQFPKNEDVAGTRFDYDDDRLFEELNVATDEEVAEYIVEDPNEIQIKFPIEPIVQLETKMPFFRAISYKLGGQKLVNN